MMTVILWSMLMLEGAMERATSSCGSLRMTTLWERVQGPCRAKPLFWSVPVALALKVRGGWGVPNALLVLPEAARR
jgi:hypothetical protein